MKAMRRGKREQKVGVKPLHDYQCPACEKYTATERTVGLLRCSDCGEKFNM